MAEATHIVIDFTISHSVDTNTKFEQQLTYFIKNKCKRPNRKKNIKVEITKPLRTSIARICELLLADLRITNMEEFIEKFGKQKYIIEQFKTLDKHTSIKWDAAATAFHDSECCWANNWMDRKRRTIDFVYGTAPENLTGSLLNIMPYVYAKIKENSTTGWQCYRYGNGHRTRLQCNEPFPDWITDAKLIEFLKGGDYIEPDRLLTTK